MASKVKILGLQIHSEINNKVANFQKVASMLRENADFKPDLVVLPETFNAGYDCESFRQNAEMIPAGETSMFLSSSAEKYNTNITGSFIEKCPDGNFRNALPMFDRTGAIVAKYHKIHLFSSQDSKENTYLTTGDRRVIAELDFAKVGMSVCYDIRFCEIYRKMALDGAEIMICSAAWPYPKLDHWITLNKARAIENQCFVVAVNQAGKNVFGKLDLGQSMVINPWGEIVASAGTQEGVVKAEIDLDMVKNIREEISLFKDRKGEAYV